MKEIKMEVTFTDGYERDSQRRVLSKWEEAMMHEQKMMEIRAAIPKENSIDRE